MTIKKALGSRVWDADDKEFLDMSSGIFVVNCGHSNELVNNAVKEQVDSGLVYVYNHKTEIREEFESDLMRKFDFRDCFLVCSGSDANEAALKIIQGNNDEKPLVIVLEDGFYGRTWGAEILNGNYFNPNIISLPYPVAGSSFLRDLAMKRISINQIGAIFIQGIRGWDLSFIPVSYMAEIESFAKFHDVLIAVDEIQSGVGRTGRLTSYEYYGLHPDIVTLGKALGNGYPVSAVLSSRRLMEKVRHGLSSTHSGWSVGCAAGLAVLNQIDQIMKKAKYMYFEERMSRLKINTNYKGMIGAILTKTVEEADELFKRILDKGVLAVHTGRASVKIGPPLTTSQEDLCKCFDILEDVCS